MKEMGEILAQQAASAVKQQPIIELVTQPEQQTSLGCSPFPPGPRPCMLDFRPEPRPCIPNCSPACTPSSEPKGCLPDYLKPPPPKPPGPN